MKPEYVLPLVSVASLLASIGLAIAMAVHVKLASRAHAAGKKLITPIQVPPHVHVPPPVSVSWDDRDDDLSVTLDLPAPLDSRMEIMDISFVSSLREYEYLRCKGRRHEASSAFFRRWTLLCLALAAMTVVAALLSLLF